MERIANNGIEGFYLGNDSTPFSNGLRQKFELPIGSAP